MNTKAKGYLLGAVAAATYGMNPLFALPLYNGGPGGKIHQFFNGLAGLSFGFGLQVLTQSDQSQNGSC